MTEVAPSESTLRYDAEILPLERAAYQHEQNGEWEESFRLRCEALAKLEALVGPLDGELASSIESLAINLYINDRYEEAEVLFLRSLAMYETLHGPEHLDVASVLSWLGYLYDDWERYEFSLPVYRRALAIQENICGTYSPEAATTCIWLGDIHKELSQHALAEPYLRRAVIIWQVQRAVEGTARLLLTQGRLAYVLFRLKRYCDALAVYQDVLMLNDGKFQFANSRRRFRNCRAKCTPEITAIGT